MSDIQVDVVDQNPVSDSMINNETVDSNANGSSAPAATESAMADVKEEAAVKKEEPKEVNSEATEVKSEDKEVKSEAVEKHKDSSDRGRGGRGGRGGRFNDRRNDDSFKKEYKRNNKFDPSALPETEDASKIRGQVEFYFSDTNLPGDKFLWTQTDGSSNVPVPVETIHKFKRMQRFQPYSAVVAALKESPTLVIEGEEGKETVRRKTPFNPAIKDNKEPRSVYVKGFGEEKPTSQFDIEAFFTNYGTTRSVRLRRHDDRSPDNGLFKGSAFCEFQDEETAQNFLKACAETKPLWDGEDCLKIMSKADYVAEKNQLIRDGKMEPAEARPKFYAGREGQNNKRGDRRGGRGGNRGGDRGGDRRGDRRDRDDSDWRKRRDQDQKSGFRDDNRRGHGRGRGRGGRDRDGDRDRDNKDRPNNTSSDVKVDSKPSEVKSESAETGTKRPREEDTATGEGPAKKQDVKTEA